MTRPRPDRLELLWPGKYDADGHRTTVPRCHPTLHTDSVFLPPVSVAPQLQLYDASGSPPKAVAGDNGPSADQLIADQLILADNLLALDALADSHAGRVDLVVADPPFATGARFDVVTRVGEGGSLGELRSPAYNDAWDGGAAGLIAMLEPRLRLAHTLLASHGSLYVHVDPTVGHAVKLLLDDIFGPGCFQREIVWRIGWVSGFKTKARNWIRNHDLIFFYVKDPKRFTFNKAYMAYPEGYTRRDGSPPTGKGVPLDDVWNGNDVEHGLRGADSMDSIQIKSFSQEKTGYPTQKNESLLRRIISASSNPGDLVVDPFCGSGTTLAVARALGRRFVGIDTSRAAVQVCLRRMTATPGPAVRVQHVQPAERDALRARGHGWAQYLGVDVVGNLDGVEPERVGTRGSRRSIVITERLGTEADLRGARKQRAEVAAWAWQLAVPVSEHQHGQAMVAETGRPPSFGGPSVAFRIERDVLAPRSQPRQGLSPLACPRLRLSRGRSGTFCIELLGLDEGWADERESVPSGLPKRGLALVDGWAVDPTGADNPAFSFAAFRRQHRRALTAKVELPWPTGPLRVRVWDVLHRTADLVVVVSPDTTRVRVASAQLQVGPDASVGIG